MQSQNIDTLREAVARSAPCVLLLASAGMTRHSKTRFLAAQDSGFWVESPHADQPLIDQLIVSGAQVGVAFKSSTVKVVFTSPVVEFCSQMAINATTRVDTVQLCWPEDLQAVQRRQDYRVTVLPDGPVSMRVWRITDHHYLNEQPSATMLLHGQLNNLSVGGFCMQCKLTGEQRPPVCGQRLRVLLTYPEGELLMGAHVMYCRELPSGAWRVGAQFQALETNLEGRRTLAALHLLLGQLQREEIRRNHILAQHIA